MKLLFFISIIFATSMVFGQINDLRIDSIYHRSNVGEYYSKGLEYYQMPENQMRLIECSSIVSNIGEYDITNCYLLVEVVFEDVSILEYHSDSVFIPSGSQDSLFLTSSVDLIGQPVGNYKFIYSIISDSIEINYLNNTDSVNFEITENTLSRSDFEISDSTLSYYPDSLDRRSFGYVFKLENDACLSAVYPWIAHDLINLDGIAATNASLFVLDSVANIYLPMGISSSYLPEFTDLGNRFKVEFDPMLNELFGGNTYLITINGSVGINDFYLSQNTIDSTVYFAYNDGAPGDVDIENSPLVNTRIIKMDIEFETAWYCSLNTIKNEIIAPKVFPNPASNKVFIQFNTEIYQNYVIQLMDLNGRIINGYTVNKTVNSIVLNMEENKISKGIYFIKISGEDINFTHKLIIQ